MKLPSWREVSNKQDEGETLNPLEQFIHDQEPAGPDKETQFRVGLENALDFCMAEGNKAIETLKQIQEDTFI